MKKALVVLLLLALVGGGLFAQVAITGIVEGGLGVVKIGEGDLGFGVLANNVYGGDGVGARLNFAWNNEGSTVGARVRLNAQAAPNENGFRDNFQVAGFWGYAKAFDGLLELRGGRINSAFIGTDDIVGTSLFTTNYGLLAGIIPADMFKISLGAYTSNSLANAKPWDQGGLTGVASVAALLGAADIIAILSTNSNETRASASVLVPALGPADINVGAHFRKLNTFANAGEMYFTLQAKLNRLVTNLGLDLRGEFGMSNAKTVNYLGFSLDGNYKIGAVKPGVFVAYVSGDTYGGYASGFSYGIDTTASDFVADSTFLSLNPYVFFGDNVKVGFVYNADLGTAKVNNGFGAYVNYSLEF